MLTLLRLIHQSVLEQNNIYMVISGENSIILKYKNESFDIFLQLIP